MYIQVLKKESVVNKDFNFACIFKVFWYLFQKQKACRAVSIVTFVYDTCIWPASHEKGTSDISHSVDQDQPLKDVENTYT